MAGVDLPVRIEPLLDRAVVGGDEEGRPCSRAASHDPAQGPVHGFDGPDRGPVFDVADDVDVGQVGHDQSRPGGAHLSDDRVGHRRPTLISGTAS